MSLAGLFIYNFLYFILDDYLDFSGSAIFPSDNKLVGGDDARMTGYNILDQYRGHIVLPDLGKSIDYVILIFEFLSKVRLLFEVIR